MPGNALGQAFRFTTWGESHGPEIGCVVDGVPPRIELHEEDIQFWLNRRRPGQSQYTTQRKEADRVKIVSGVFEGFTTGTPVGLIIENQDHRSRDYQDIKDKFRPSHADYTYWAKYGIRDYRGGGRASARETAMRVAAGAIARKVLGESVSIRGALIQIGDQAINRESWDWDEVERNPFWCPDADTASNWENELKNIRKKGLSLGAIIEIVASGVLPGLGEPVYDKLDGDIAKALMTINAVKAVEIGAGFNVVAMTGEENADEMQIGSDGKPDFLSNNAGGILGGISTGQDIVVRFAVKPTSSILRPVRTIDTGGRDTEIATKGRHDPCVGIRAVPVGEAMVASVLADHMLRHKGQVGW